MARDGVDPRHERFLEIAIREATLALNEGDFPVGAILVSDTEEVIARSQNRMKREGGLALHAELLLLLGEQRVLKNRTHQFRLYSSLEPCVMCLGACYISNLHEVVWAANDYWAGGTRSLNNSSQYISTHGLLLTPTPCPRLEIESAKLIHCFFSGRNSTKGANILGPYLQKLAQ